MIPLSTWVTNDCHAALENLITVPERSFESRIRTMEPAAATSTQSPDELALLLRQPPVAHTIPITVASWWISRVVADVQDSDQHERSDR